MITNIQNHTPKSDEHYLFDTNIWLFLFCPIANHKSFVVDKYSRFYFKILKSDAKIYTTTLILSEFINRYLRIDCTINEIAAKDFKKTYRPSAECTNTLKLIEDTVKRKILPNVVCLDDEMTKISFDDVFRDCFSSDFTDSYFANLIRGKDISILTDDGDFSYYSLTHNIFTGNPKLIKGK